VTAGGSIPPLPTILCFLHAVLQAFVAADLTLAKQRGGERAVTASLIVPHMELRSLQHHSHRRGDMLNLKGPQIARRAAEYQPFLLIAIRGFSSANDHLRRPTTSFCYQPTDGARKCHALCGPLGRSRCAQTPWLRGKVCRRRPLTPPAYPQTLFSGLPSQASSKGWSEVSQGSQGRVADCRRVVFGILRFCPARGLEQSFARVAEKGSR
jgi:hypothetical protein